MERKKYTRLSFVCLALCIIAFIGLFVVGTLINTGDGNGSGLGPVFAWIAMLSPIFGIILGIIGEKGKMKLVAIIGNIAVLCT